MSEQSRGSDAMHYVADRLGLEVESAPWYDLISPAGVKYEVKSGMDKVRFWEDQHRSLTACNNGNGSAWYVVVETTESGGVVGYRKYRPTAITKAINAADGWVKSGHDRTDDREKYLPVSELV